MQLSSEPALSSNGSVCSILNHYLDLLIYILLNFYFEDSFCPGKPAMLELKLSPAWGFQALGHRLTFNA